MDDKYTKLALNRAKEQSLALPDLAYFIRSSHSLGKLSPQLNFPEGEEHE